MRIALRLLIVLVLSSLRTAGATQQPSPAPAAPVQTENIGPNQAPPPVTGGVAAAAASEGAMEASQVKELLHRLWLAEYRINDLLTEVHPDRWKIPETARASFRESFGALQEQMRALEGWRGQFEVRPDSIYLGYMTHALIDAILPRLDGVTPLIMQRENASLGAQFSKSVNQLFDVQQALQPHLSNLLRNQDQVFYATQTNLAACESRLGAALRGQSPPAKIIPNIVPEFKGRRVRKPSATPAASPAPAKPQTKPGEPAKKK
jgi:hypothetical protein